MSNIPDYYREWAKKEAEKRYTGDWDGELGGYFVCRDTYKQDGSTIFLMSPKDESYLMRRMKEAYEAALLRMWPVVEAIEIIAGHSSDATAQMLSKDALNSLNLPKP